MRLSRHLLPLIFLLASLATPCLGASQLTFDSSARPRSLVLNGASRLSSNSSDGFHLRYFNGKDVSDTRLGHAVTAGDMVTVTESGGLPSFTFRIDTYDRHLSIHLVSVEGLLLDQRNHGIRLQLTGNASLGAKSLDDVVDADERTTDMDIDWQYLWGEELGGSKGGVALYDNALTGASLDACLASIWANEPLLPRPAGQPSWTESDVLAWVDQYQTDLAGMNEVILEASTPTELYNLTDAIALSNNVKRVYLHTKTWRGEYWPNHNSRVHVNTAVFPAGKPDLVVYANYLAANGIYLRLHSVSCGIGRNEAPYIGSTVDRRLASWGTGTLEEAINSSETRLLFRPDAGTVIPLLGINIGHTGKRLYYEWVRVGEEIIQVGSFHRTEEEVWVLDGCTRGYQGASAASHSAGTEVAGLHCSYGQNYIPAYDLDQPTSLMDELALEYATFVNDVGLGHLHFDGPEIHDIHPWVIRELLDRIYSYVDHPVTSSRVGRSIAANFEQAFSGIRDDRTIVGYFALNIDIRPDDPGRLPSTSRLDTHFHAQESIMLNARRPFFSVPQSGWGITEDIMDHHGLFDEMLGLYRDWNLLASALHADDVDYIASVTSRTPGSSHYETEDVLVLGTNTLGKYTFTTRHVMGRSSGEDPPFQIEQEKGAVPRKQLITSGDVLELNNKKAAQELDYIIRVVHTESSSLVSPTVQIVGGGSLTVTGTVDPGEYLEYTGGTSAQLYDENWNLVSHLPASASSFNVAVGDNDVTVTHTGGSPVDLETQFIVTGAVYELKTNDTIQG